MKVSFGPRKGIEQALRAMQSYCRLLQTLTKPHHRESERTGPACTLFPIVTFKIQPKPHHNHIHMNAIFDHFYLEIEASGMKSGSNHKPNREWMIIHETAL